MIYLELHVENKKKKKKKKKKKNRCERGLGPTLHYENLPMQYTDFFL